MRAVVIRQDSGVAHRGARIKCAGNAASQIAGLLAGYFFRRQNVADFLRAFSLTDRISESPSGQVRSIFVFDLFETGSRFARFDFRRRLGKRQQNLRE